MADYDGDVQLSVDLDTADLLSGTQKLTNELRRALSDDSIGSKLYQDIQKVVTEADKAVAKLTEIGNTPVKTDSYANILDALDKYDKKIEEIGQKQERYLETGGKPSSSAYKRMSYDIDMYAAKAEKAEAALAKMRDEGTAFVDGNTTQAFADQAAKVEQLDFKLAALIEKYRDLKTAQADQAAQAKADAEADRAAQETEDAVNKAGLQHVFAGMGKGEGVEGLINGLKHLGQSAVEAGTKIGKIVGIVAKLGSAAIKAGAKVKELAKKGLDRLKKSHDSAERSLKKGLRTFLRYGLGIRGTFMLIRKLRAALKEGFGNIAKISDPMNEAISNLMTSLAQLKNNLAAAFAPVAQVILPILTSLIDALNAVISKIGQFFAIMSGQKTFLRATKVQQNYRKSLEKTGSAAAEAKKQLLGFDDVTILQDNSKSGGGGSSGTDPSEMFETVPIDSALGDLFGTIKNFIDSQNWYGLGVWIGTKLTNMFNTAADAVSWDNLGTKLTTIITGITDFINGLLTGFDFGSVGRFIGNGLQTIINAFNLFFENIRFRLLGNNLADLVNDAFYAIDFTTVGQFFANGLNSIIHIAQGFFEDLDFRQMGIDLGQTISTFINETDWAAAADAISKAVIGAIDFLSETIRNTDWVGVFNAIWEFLSNIDWGGLVRSLFELIGTVVGELAHVLWEGIKAAWDNVVGWFDEAAGEDGELSGEEFFNAVLDGIVNVITGIATWVRTNILDPFIGAIAKVFGFGDENGSASEVGHEIIDNLLGGIKKKWEDVKTFFSKGWQGIKDLFSGKKDEQEGVGRAVVRNIDTGLQNNRAQLGVKNTITNLASDVQKDFSGADWTSVGSAAVTGIGVGADNPGALSSLREKFRGIANSVLSTAKRALGIHSPSTVFRDEVGKMITAGMEVGVESTEKDVVASVTNLSDKLAHVPLKDIQMPDIVTGKVIPTYAVAQAKAQESMAASIIEKLNADAYNRLTRDDLREVMIEMFRDYMNIDFHIGDEQVARHAQAGAMRLDRRLNPVGGTY